LEAAATAYFEVLYRNLSEETGSVMIWPNFRKRFEPETSQLRSRNTYHSTVDFSFLQAKYNGVRLLRVMVRHVWKRLAVVRGLIPCYLYVSRIRPSGFCGIRTYF